MTRSATSGKLGGVTRTSHTRPRSAPVNAPSLPPASAPASPGRIVWTQAATLLGVALVTLGLYAFGSAEALAQRATRPEVAAWAVRSLAVAAIAGGQLLFATGVIPGVFGRGGVGRRGPFETAYGLATGLLALLSAVAGAALLAAAA